MSSSSKNASSQNVPDFKAIIAMALLVLSPTVTAGPLQTGANAALFGRCTSDVLTPDRIQMAAALGALAPSAVNQVAPAPDELAQIEHMCAQAIHSQRCSEKVVAVAGTLITSQKPAGKVNPPAVNPGTIVGGTAGAVLGTIAGADRGTGSAILGGTVGAWGGAKLGAKVFEGGAAGACINERARLDKISSRLLGSANPYSIDGVLGLIERNRGDQIISNEEAKALSDEVVRLSARAQQVLNAAR